MRKILLTAALLAPILLQQAAAQNRQVSGRITDRATGQGLPGVTVLVKGTTIGVSTNADGSYTIGVPASATTLTFSSIGFVALERPIGTASTIDVGLSTDSKQLGEVVVTGALGIERQARELGYSTTTISNEDITQARVTNVTNGLAGKVAGLQIQTVNNGVNPDIRITLRGNRSLTGQNQALVVIDGVQQPDQNVLSTLNPDDIADITVLKGANAAALYGSLATNGALIVTTKKGSVNKPTVNFSHTSTFEQISFKPDLQNEFGPGSDSWQQVYTPFENQQYGDRFDGSTRPIGLPTITGNQQQITYSDKGSVIDQFFKTGYQMQNGVSFSGGDQNTKFFLSVQNVKNRGIVPKDLYERNSFRANASRQMGKLSAGATASFSVTDTDQFSTGGGANPIYFTILNTSSVVNVADYKDWRTNEFANPNGYYNEYYANPYYDIDNNRINNRLNTFIGSIDLGYKITEGLSAIYRLGITRRDQASKDYSDKFAFTQYTLTRPDNARIDRTGFVENLNSSNSQVNSDLLLTYDKRFDAFSLKAIVGNNIRQNDAQFVRATANALSVPGLFNVGSNRVGELTGAQGQYRTRVAAVFADVTLGYRDFLFLHGSGRQEGQSTLDKDFRSYFFPSVDASLVLSEAIPALKDASFLDYAKLRAGYAKVGQVNLSQTVAGVANNFGAYRLNPVYAPGTGFPFGSLASYSLSNVVIAPDLKPEFTSSYEAGLELAFLKGRVNASSSVYFQKSTGQTIQADVARSTGFSNYLLNAGEVQNRGIEVALNLKPVQTDNFVWQIGANYNYNNNEVISVTDQIDQLALTTGGLAQSYAIKGKPYPYLKGSDYVRDENGRIQLTEINLGTFTGANGQVLPRRGWVPSRAGQSVDFGNTLPKHILGMNTSFTFKGLTLAAQGEYRAGYVILNQIASDLDFTGASGRSAEYGREPFILPNSSILVDGQWVPNTTNLTPGGAEFWANASYNRSIASNYVTKGNFFKLREVSLNYAVPATVLGGARFVKGVNLNLFARNVLLVTAKENKYTDPEFSFTSGNGIGINDNRQTPPTRFLGASISATL